MEPGEKPLRASAICSSSALVIARPITGSGAGVAMGASCGDSLADVAAEAAVSGAVAV